MPLGFEKGALNPYIIDSTDHTQLPKTEESKSKQKSYGPREEDLVRDPFVPNFIRPVPDYDPEELKIEGVWLTPGVLPEPYWDYTLGSDVAQMKKLMKKIHEQPLSK